MGYSPWVCKESDSIEQLTLTYLCMCVCVYVNAMSDGDRDYNVRQSRVWDFLGVPVAKTPHTQCKGAQIRYLVRELDPPTTTTTMKKILHATMKILHAATKIQYSQINK